MPFAHPYTIALYDTDAAGVIFSANIIRICHHAWEALMAKLGFGLDRLFRERTLSLPVVHIEADFLKPLTVGMRVVIEARVEQIGQRSFRMAYTVRAETGEVCATAAIVQVCVHPRTFDKVELPPELRAALEGTMNDER